MNTTVRLKASEIYKDWHVIDAADRPLGRVASEAATLLRGKHKPAFEPHLDAGDFVIIVNASKVKVTGRKTQQNAYYTHSGFPGGLRKRSMADTMERFPARVIEAAVKGMLPGGPLGEAISRHLKVYAGPTHPHQSQVTGTERARAVREALAAEQLLATKKPARLRPLSVPDAAPVVVAEPVARAKPAAPPRRAPKLAEKVAPAPVAASVPDESGAAPAPARRARKVAEAVAAPPAEAAAAAAPARRARKAAEATKVAEPVVEKAAAEAPKKRAPRKRTEPESAVVEISAASPTDEAPKKPARRRAAPKQEE